MKTVCLLFLFFAACAAGPNPADVMADRARWTAVRDTTADGTVDANEAPLLAELLTVWDSKLTADEAAAGRSRDPKQIAADLLRVYGAAVITAVLGELTPEFAKIEAQFPEAFRLVDKNSDHLISLDELTTVDPTNPVFAAVVAQTAVQLIRRKR